MPIKHNLSIIGLGKLGSSMVAAYASKGYKVVGVDLNDEFVKAVNEGRAPVVEPHLAEYLSRNKERISATTDYKDAVLNSDISFIIVPTPSKENGDFSTEYVVQAGKKIAQALKEKQGFHLVVLTSTVTPGSTERELLFVLEKYSEKKCGQDFGLCYNPEFIALGSVIQDLLNPDFILIGEFDKRSGDILEEFYKNICFQETPIKRMNIVNAEITKIALNTYVTTKISYANMLAELCEKIPGANVDVVTDALGCDSRIGSKYLKGALGYGGPCFPRDNRALISVAKKFNASLPIAEVVDKINQKQTSRLAEKVISLLPPNGKTAILGLSYKPDTPVIEESQGVALAKFLLEKNIHLIVYDPMAMENARNVFGDKVYYASSLKKCLESADVIIITTPWHEFKAIEPGDLKREHYKPVLIDCWRILDYQKYQQVVKYVAPGINLLWETN